MNLFLAFLLTFLSVLGYSFISIIIGRVTRRHGAFWTGLWIQTLGLVLTVLLIPFFGINLSLNIYLLALGIFGVGIAFNYILYCRNLSIGPASVIQSILILGNLITFLLAIVLLGERVTYSKIFGGLIIITGVVLVSLNIEELVKKRIQTLTKAVPLTLLQATIGGVIFFILSLGTKHFAGFSASVGTRLFTVPTFFLISLIQPKPKEPIMKLSWKILLFIAFIDVIAYILYNTAIKKYDVSFVTIIQSTQPVVTAIIAALFYKEKLHLFQKVGIFTTVIGSMLFVYS